MSLHDLWCFLAALGLGLLSMVGMIALVGAVVWVFATLADRYASGKALAWVEEVGSVVWYGGAVLTVALLAGYGLLEKLGWCR